ncbi:acyl-CoA thioesterase [Streptomyces boncukensis]|uniref:Acyl-CoA thioesterase n=1 Tax=Streptomyces boncukensis TaxID=2711219 RepID=A0A6G4X8V0_9ACTN|nr:acyl-CoA thioesterase [Streptomyces boncukensis]NGO73673.1 acyl-CoA thioesterase [Streptomyces boncukensis]
MSTSAQPEPRPFSVRVSVRGYELDTQGHLNQAVYLQYAEHARWEVLRAAGVGQAELLALGVGPVVLETRVRYLRELRAGDEVDVSCMFEWLGGKTFHFVQDMRTADGTVAAEVTSVGGFLDLARRRLVPDPRKPLAELATDLSLLNLAD